MKVAEPADDASEPAPVDLKAIKFPWLTSTLLIRDPKVGTEAESEEAPINVNMGNGNKDSSARSSSDNRSKIRHRVMTIYEHMAIS